MQPAGHTQFYTTLTDATGGAKSGRVIRVLASAARA